MVGDSAAQTSDGWEILDLLGKKGLCPEEVEEGEVVGEEVALSTDPALAAVGLGRSW